MKNLKANSIFLIILVISTMIHSFYQRSLASEQKELAENAFEQLSELNQQLIKCRELNTTNAKNEYAK